VNSTLGDECHAFAFCDEAIDLLPSDLTFCLIAAYTASQLTLSVVGKGERRSESVR